MLRQRSVESLLQTVAELTEAVLRGDPEASIYVQDRRRQLTVVSTGQLARELDEVQYAEHHGPCLHAATARLCPSVR